MFDPKTQSLGRQAQIVLQYVHPLQAAAFMAVLSGSFSEVPAERLRQVNQMHKELHQVAREYQARLGK